jgi:hypothetical protein
LLNTSMAPLTTVWDGCARGQRPASSSRPGRPAGRPRTRTCLARRTPSTGCCRTGCPPAPAGSRSRPGRPGSPPL